MKELITLPKLPEGTGAKPFNFGRGKFEVRAADDAAVIDVFDAIGEWGVSARSFAAKLDEAKAARSLTVRLNSPGGDVFDGIAIYNQLAQSGKPVRVEILGMAASAASVIAMAGDEIAIAENAFLMIHNAWGIVAGNKVDMRSFAAVLDQIDAALVATYARRTGGDAGEIAAMMDAETWLAGPEAIERGFAGELLDSDGEALAFDLSVYHNAPSVLPSGHTEPTRRDAERALRDAGFSRAKAKAIAAIVDSDGLRDAGSANVSEIVARLDAIAAGLKSRT